jgi:hypothetical protein
VQIVIGETIIICFANLIPENCEGTKCIDIMTEAKDSPEADWTLKTVYG